ncbi:MAG: hypothetical protein K2H85_09955 [Allobaculum sp.]|nr:hypothetical protein [Allobaculum sp.]
MPNYENFKRFRPIMEAMNTLDKDNMEPLLLDQDPQNGLKEYYCAHTDYMDSEAKVVFIGICPGFEQMRLSFELVKHLQSSPEPDVLRQAKVKARFGGSMRQNLIDLANQTDLASYLGVESVQDLFNPDCHLMDNTALLPYPIFRDGKNYTGHAPKINRSGMLKAICETQLQKIKEIYPNAVFIPLGKAVDEQLSQANILPEEKIIHGFPHPSGANGHRFKQLDQNRAAINAKLKTAFLSQERQRE